MSNFGNFGTQLGQSGMTMVNPYFDFNGPFTAQQFRKVDSMVAYYPASMHHEKKKKKHGGMMGARKGFVQGYVGRIS